VTRLLLFFRTAAARSRYTCSSATVAANCSVSRSASIVLIPISFASLPTLSGAGAFAFDHLSISDM
jgi:hypothetical protein